MPTDTMMQNISDKQLRNAMVEIYDETPTQIDQGVLDDVYARLNPTKAYKIITATMQGKGI